MRDDQSWFFGDEIAIQNQVEVERPRGARIGAVTAEASFEVEKNVEKGSRGEVGNSGYRRVQEARLVAYADGSGFMKRGNAQVAQVLGKSGDRRVERSLAIAEIAAKRNRDRNH